MKKIQDSLPSLSSVLDKASGYWVNLSSSVQFKNSLILWRLNNECCEIKTLDLGPKKSKFWWKYYQSIRSIDRWKQPKRHKCLSRPCRKMEPQTNHHLIKLTNFHCWSRDPSCFKIEDSMNLNVQPSLQRAKWKPYSKKLWNIIWKLANIYQNINYLNVGIYFIYYYYYYYYYFLLEGTSK